MLRVVLGIIVWNTIAVGRIVMAEVIGHRLYPPPFGLPDTIEAFGEYVKTTPPMALLFPPLGWFTGIAIGGSATPRMTGKHWAGWLIACVALARVIINRRGIRGGAVRLAVGTPPTN